MQRVEHLPELAIPQRRTIARSNVIVGVLLVVTMLIGGYFRFVGLNWDDFTHLHPDERFLTDVVQGLSQLNPSGSDREAHIAECLMRYPETGGKGGYFDAHCSVLNPLNANSGHGLYVYGTLPLFITKGFSYVVADVSTWFAQNVLANSDPSYAMYDGSYWTTYDGVALVWRFLSAMSEMGVIVITFLIGVKLHDKWVGILATFLYAATVFSIQLAHFGTVDAMSNFFAALSILYAVRVQRDGKLLNYALFGVFFGCSVASRINLAPLAALIAFAALMHLFPLLEHNVAPHERSRTLIYHVGGLVLAAFLSLLVFRVLNPYAFTGPGFFGLSLYPRWLENIGTAQAMNAGVIDSPPNFQWVARTPYLYPLQNMVLWGMGFPLGIVAWVAWVVAGYRILRGKPGALANLLLVVWVLIYFGWLGRNWVTTMRYFIPAYPALIVLGAWGMLGLYRRARPYVLRRAFAFTLIAVVTVFSLLWAAMFTNIYRHMLTRVQATHWIWENVPGDFAMRVNDPLAQSPIINIDVPNNGLGDRRVYNVEYPASAHDFVAPATGEVSAVYAYFMDDPQNDAADEFFYFTVTTRGADGEDVVLSEALYSRDLTYDDDEPAQIYTIPFSSAFTLEQDREYSFNVLLLDGGPAIVGSFVIPITVESPADEPLINIPIPNNNYGGSPDDLVSKATRFDQFTPNVTVGFTAPVGGVVTSIYAPHLGDPNNDPEPETLRLTVRSGDAVLATATLSANLPVDENNILGYSYDIPLDEPLLIEQGGQYTLTVELLGGGVVVSGGALVTWEGAWDDPVPTGVCALPIGITLADDPPPGLYLERRDCDRWLDPWWGLVTGYTQDIVYEDEESKRQKLLLTLDNSDYITISSNRFYDTLSRNPLRWTMTNLYYDKLFAGELGYDLVATFQETFELGPLRVSDQYLPTYDAPEWLNEFEAEEAFHVYDHPVVFIFEKRADYDKQAVHDLLYSVPLTRVGTASLRDCPGAYDPARIYTPLCSPELVGVATLNSYQASEAPTALQLTNEMRDIQSEGTWSDRFDVNGIVNTNQVVGVVIWYLTIMVFGFAAFPLLFVVLPGFADRGYGFAKFAGMLLTGWGTWYLASLRVPVWSQAGIAGALALLALIGLALLWRRREEFADFLRQHWRRLAAIELITLLLFVAMLLVRLANPDLWHPAYGGEKPMDFAYFNGVLRSTIFPPIDPWFSGGYINYYYFGFVIVGTPVLLLKMIPSFAYNLILPTLYAATGIAAFTIAFTAVDALRERRASRAETMPKRRRIGSPWLAGLVALLLAIVLGNLDTPRVFLTGVARAGGYVQSTGIEDYLLKQYIAEHDTAPDAAAMVELSQRAQNPGLIDSLRYELDNSIQLVSSIANGFGKMFSGQEIYISAERWFWAPTRVLDETPGVRGNAITEMPIFTYIYADLHAHMIAMPMQLAVAGFLLNELLMAGRDQRRRKVVFAALLLLGIYAGMLRATNTWDWITYMLLGVVGLSLAWWLAQVARDPGRTFFERFTRRSLLHYAAYVGGFVVLSFIAVLPFTTWYTSSYNSIRPWLDGKTPLWAYFDIHGLFIFLIFSLLLWDTGRWFRSVYVRSLRGTWLLLLALAAFLLLALAASVVLAIANYQVTLIVLPLLIWTAALFFRQGQSRVMQFVLLLVGLALGLTLGVEYVVLEGDIGRQNTVFKFYIQAWLLFSIAGGVAVSWLVGSMERWRSSVRNAWLFVLVLLVGIASLFPIMAQRGKAVFRFDTNAPLTLDGMAYMTYASHWEGSEEIRLVNPELSTIPLAEDYAMIRWLQDNVSGSPVIAEGLSEGSLYKWNGRIAIYTGLPAIIGWDWHQKQQRTVEPMGNLVDRRIANVNALYQTTSIGTAWEILRHYNVSYLVVGRLEQAYYHAEGLAKFDHMAELGLLEPVFTEGNSTIYRVNEDAQLTDRG